MIKFTSRKFLLTVLGVACTIVLMCTGALSPAEGAKLIAAQIGAYVGVEGIIDMIGIQKRK